MRLRVRGVPGRRAGNGLGRRHERRAPRRLAGTARLQLPEAGDRDLRRFLIISTCRMLSCTFAVLLTTEMSGEGKERDLDLVNERLPFDPSAAEISRRSA